MINKYSKFAYSTLAILVATAFSAEALADHPPGKGGKLVASINTGPGGFNSLKMPVNARNRLMVMQAIHEKLFDFNADTNKLIPRLASSATASDDFKRWRIVLRKGSKFSDGVEVTSAAYKLHFDTLLGSKFGGRFRGYMGPRMKGVEVVDKYTFDFVFKQASPGFNRILAQPNLMWYVKSPKFVASMKTEKGFKKIFHQKEVGAGPYMLKEWRRGNSLVLVRNPHYYNPKLQHVDELKFLIIPQQISRFQAQQAGQVDIGGIPPWLEDDSQKDASLSTKKGLNNIAGLGLAWNNEKAPFDDIRVRRALIQALDRRKLTGIITKLDRDPPIDMYGKGHPWHCPNIKWPAKDPAAAKKLIDAYKAETGKDVNFTFWMPPLRDLQRVGEAMQSMWKKVGITATIKSGPRGPSFRRNIEAGKYGFWWANFGQNADPSMTALNFHSKHRANFFKIKSPKIDAAIGELLKARGRDNRYKASCNYQQVLVDESRFLVWELPARIVSFRNHVKNIPTPHALQIEFHRASVK